jgi:hypothetical protein
MEGDNPLVTVAEILPESLKDLESKVADVAEVVVQVASSQVTSPPSRKRDCMSSDGVVVVLPMTPTKQLEG